jgi:hypothetical protein
MVVITVITFFYTILADLFLLVSINNKENIVPTYNNINYRRPPANMHKTQSQNKDTELETTG